MATKFTVDLLSILAYFYESVSIIKPKSSRPANSEKYVVCVGFRFTRTNEDLHIITEQLLDILYEPLAEGNYVNNLMASTDHDIEKTVVSFNSIFMKKQTEVIASGQDYASRYIDTGCVDLECMNTYVREQLDRALAFHKEIAPQRV
jgi:hypothetical protein